MSAVPPSAILPSPGPAAGTWGRYDRVVGWLMLALWVALMASALLLGTRASTYEVLQARVASGEVAVVEVAGDPLPPGADGSSAVVVRWRDGLVRRSAWVTEASSPREARRVQRGDSDRSVVVGTVSDQLIALDPDLRFTRGELLGSSFVLAGLEGPGWVGIGWLALVVGCLVLCGPRTWRASGWAWAWLILLVPPYGALAFLALGGPTGLFPPRQPRRVWLTGGWGFLLALVLGGGPST